MPASGSAEPSNASLALAVPTRDRDGTNPGSRRAPVSLFPESPIRGLFATGAATTVPPAFHSRIGVA
jgi:hypothetical protein